MILFSVLNLFEFCSPQVLLNTVVKPTTKPEPGF